MKLHTFGLVLAAGWSLLGGWAHAELTPTRLTCEYLSDPPVVDVCIRDCPGSTSLRTGNGDSAKRPGRSAWRVHKARLERPDLWDSGRVDSSRSVQIAYDGVALRSRTECWWQVRVWDRDGKPSAWSPPADWRMGLLEPTDWKAEWIGAPWQGEEALPKPKGGPDARPAVLPPPAPLLRKEFSIDKEVTRAVAFVTGLGYFELYLNGEKVGDDELVPNQTNYGKRPELSEAPIPLEDDFRDYKVMYLAYDLKDYLKPGAERHRQHPRERVLQRTQILDGLVRVSAFSRANPPHVCRWNRAGHRQ